MVLDDGRDESDSADNLRSAGLVLYHSQFISVFHQVSLIVDARIYRPLTREESRCNSLRVFSIVRRRALLGDIMHVHSASQIPEYGILLFLACSFRGFLESNT